jgi:transposase InsO family protein
MLLVLMNLKKLPGIDEIPNILKGIEEFEVRRNKKGYQEWLNFGLNEYGYKQLNRKEKGLVFEFFKKVTGLSRAQLHRLIHNWKHGKSNSKTISKRPRFNRKYTDDDIRLIAQTDNLHLRLNGAATKYIFEREYTLFKKPEYERLSKISISHLYNLRQSSQYQRQSMTYTHTQATKNNIGERRKPFPDGKPGYIRIDTVHQGDLNGKKGVYHINAVDEETQWQVVATVEGISERFMMPVLEQILASFPFIIIEFHSDNGSEFINTQVAAMLKKMMIDLTKSRARKTNDNALVESKNGAVVRKHFGYCHIPSNEADAYNRYNFEMLNRYLNYHRPCFFPECTMNKKGKIKKVYPYSKMKTPYEKLKSIENAENFLKPGISFDDLDKVALQYSDNEFAERMVKARADLVPLNRSVG